MGHWYAIPWAASGLLVCQVCSLLRVCRVRRKGPRCLGHRRRFLGGMRVTEVRERRQQVGVPLDQPVPGPAGRVPRDWQERLHE